MQKYIKALKIIKKSISQYNTFPLLWKTKCNRKELRKKITVLPYLLFLSQIKINLTKQEISIQKKEKKKKQQQQTEVKDLAAFWIMLQEFASITWWVLLQLERGSAETGPMEMNSSCLPHFSKVSRAQTKLWKPKIPSIFASDCGIRAWNLGRSL